MTPSQKLRSIADSTGLDGIANAIREVANEIDAPAVPQGEPVAVIGSGWTFLWASGDAIEDIVKRHGLKIGSKLYAAPSQPVTAALRDLVAAVQKEMSPDWICSSYHPHLHSALYAAIAALREKQGGV